MTKFPLANDGDGNPLEVPANAVAWRVRRGGGRRGRPRIVFDNETGRQLEVPLESTINDLVDHACPPGRYRLEAIDGNGKLIPGCVGVTEIPLDAIDAEEMTPAKIDREDRFMLAIERLVDIVVRSQETIAQAIGPIRPAQQPMVIEKDDDSDDKSESNGEYYKLGANLASELLGLVRDKRKTIAAAGGEQ